MKKTAVISIFIFLASLFSGIFFSTGISDDNAAYLSSLLVSSITNGSASFFRTFLSALTSNLFLAALMLASILTKLLSPLPFLILGYKSFAIGFCSGLLYLSDAENAFFISLLRILPPSLFFIPAFIMLAASASIYSHQALIKTKRPSREKKDLQSIVFISLAAIGAGCIVQALVL